MQKSANGVKTKENRGSAGHFRGLALAFFLGVALICAVPRVFADGGHTFDLLGPRLDVTVTRGGRTFPISKITELLPGDQLWIRPEFPGDQSVHYLLIVSFLQGPTNPPPESWFTRTETWTKLAKEQGTYVTVPSGAEQALIFFAPETGGDFATLRTAVRGRPGVFVRAAQDLEQASLDRTRLDKYMEEITKTSNNDPSALKKNSTLLAQTLRLKINEECFSRPVEQQSACLVQANDQMVLDDTHDQSLVATLTSGASSDLVGNISASPLARGGYFSPYVGAVVDVVRLLGGLHTAMYQYIPALSLPSEDAVILKLNSAPSFRNPKSVIVVSLPSIGLSPLPVLHAVDPKQILCLQQSPLVLPVEGAPLMFSTDMSHDLMVRLEGKSTTPQGKSAAPVVELPVKAEAVRGGFVVDTRTLDAANMETTLTATLHGYWGYLPFDGPSFTLHNAHAEHWAMPPADSPVLLAGHPATLHLQGDCAACVEKVELINAKGKDLKPTWKVLAPDQLEIELPLKEAPAGKLELAVAQFGQGKPDVVALQAYADTARLEHFTMFAGDNHGILTGTHLEEVASLELEQVHFTPGKEAAKENSMELSAESAAEGRALKPSSATAAHVTLKDGRKLDVPATIASPRPKLTLVNKSVQPGAAPSPVHFSKPEALPQDSKLSFFLKAEAPGGFPRTEKIEVAAQDGSFSAMLSLADGTLMQQDADSVLGLLDPQKAFGASAFGPLQFRGVDADGGKGDWQALAVLVRVPTLKEIRCPDSTEKPCSLIGTNLFLLESVASNAEFKNAVKIPAGDVSESLDVPRPYGTRLYIKLRDDPSTAATVALPVFPDTH